MVCRIKQEISSHSTILHFLSPAFPRHVTLQLGHGVSLTLLPQDLFSQIGFDDKTPSAILIVI